MLWCMVRTTPKALALGAQLRSARTASKLSLRELGRRLQVDHSVLSRYESGERSPEPEEVAAILALLGVNGGERERIIDLARDTGGSSWIAVGLPEQRAQLAALLDFEQMATEIVDVSPLLVPGLLQTGSYARAIMRAAGVPDDEVETRVAVRVGRRDVLMRERPAHLTALVGEAVLRQMVGGPKVMGEQLQHMLQMSQLPNVDLRVVSSKVDWHPGLDGPFVLMTLDKATSVVHLENRLSGLFLHEKGDLAAYQGAAEKVLRVAMSAEETAELIAREAERIKRE